MDGASCNGSSVFTADPTPTLGGLLPQITLQSHFIEAAKNGDLTRMRQLHVTGSCRLNVRCPPDGSTALYLAACNGHVLACDWLVRHGADMELETERSGSIALHGAADRGHGDCVRLLLRSRPSSVNRRTKNGDTPLHLAAFRGHADICRLLLGHGACAEATNVQGLTALDDARTTNHYDVFQLLYRHQSESARRQLNQHSMNSCQVHRCLSDSSTLSRESDIAKAFTHPARSENLIPSVWTPVDHLQNSNCEDLMKANFNGYSTRSSSSGDVISNGQRARWPTSVSEDLLSSNDLNYFVRSPSLDVFFPASSACDRERLTTNAFTLRNNNLTINNPHQLLPPTATNLRQALNVRHSAPCECRSPSEGTCVGVYEDPLRHVSNANEKYHLSLDDSKSQDNLAKTASSNATALSHQLASNATPRPMCLHSSCSSSIQAGADFERGSSETVDYLLRNLSLLESRVSQLQIEREAREERVGELERQNARLSVQVVALSESVDLGTVKGLSKIPESELRAAGRC